jgi:hypothetical protein
MNEYDRLLSKVLVTVEALNRLADFLRYQTDLLITV